MIEAMNHCDNISPITSQPVIASIEWTNRFAAQRIRVEYDADAARMCVRVGDRWEIIEQAQRTGATFDLSNVHEEFRRTMHELDPSERPSCARAMPIDFTRPTARPRRSRRWR
jgi:hypothetical protein